MTQVLDMFISFNGMSPKVHSGVWIAPTATIAGDVEIGENSSIWFNTVIRGDVAPIRIGRETNIQDGCIIHSDHQPGVIIGDRVSIGHQVILHGCEIQDGTLVGMGSIIMDDAVIGKNCIVAAGSLVTSNSRFEDGTLILGRPAKVVKQVTPEQIERNKVRIEHYIRLKSLYGEG
jgi:carbonic anhydrase/acetyltransferase-like protein (isoleucine patch superfamily)